VLDGIFPYNISLQVLDGIATHNGEVEFETYYPAPLSSFEEFDEMIDRCYQDRVYMAKRMPSTLEGNVVRLADIIAYLGKDRQDAMRTGTAEEGMFINEDIGSINAEIINNLVTNIIENSYGKPYIQLDSKHFKALRKSKQDNYRMIYLSDSVNPQIKSTLQPMMTNIYGQLLDDLKNGAKYSPIFSHHIDYVHSNTAHYYRERPYESGEPNQIVVDYIASMTDDYLIELHAYLFPESDLKVQYKGYFDE
jgi:dGTPase